MESNNKQVKKNIIVTGASGFIGKHFMEDIDLNLYQVSLITRTKQKIKNHSKKFKIVEADLQNVETLKKALENCDILINLAAEVRNSANFEKTNVQGTKNLIEAIVFCKVQKIIHLSSVGVVGSTYSFDDKNSIIDEKTSCYPKIEYERTKLISEELLLDAKHKYKLDLIVLRPTNVFGEYHSFHALLHLMKHLKSKKLVLLNKNAIINYLYVKDLTRLIIFLIEYQKDIDILNVGHSEKLKTFFHLLSSILYVKIKCVFIPDFLINLVETLGVKKLRVVSNKVNYDDSKLQTLFTYPFGLEIGLKRTVEYYKNNKLLN